MNKQGFLFTYCNDDGEEIEHTFPSKFSVCPKCEGNGTHVNPSVDGHGITAEEWEREWDEESRENYFNGVYDVTCYECKGLRVVNVIDEDRFSDKDKKIYKIYLEWEEERAQWRAIERMERMMGA